jgi:hypothetical protein
VVRVELDGRHAGRCGIRARELDQHGGPGGIVVRAGTAAVVVPMRHHDDRSRRAAHRLGDEVLKADASATGDLRVEAFRPDREAVGLELSAEPVDGGGSTRRAG